MTTTPCPVIGLCKDDVRKGGRDRRSETPESRPETGPIGALTQQAAIGVVAGLFHEAAHIGDGHPALALEMDHPVLLQG